MAEKSVESTIKQYIKAVRGLGIHVRHVVLFGSYARKNAGEWSDIDLIIIAPEFEPPVDRELVSQLWELRAVTDSRIEPIPCGEREWETDDTRPIIEIARREGIIIAA
jgi:predicted nucleotidyltransferase